MARGWAGEVEADAVLRLRLGPGAGAGRGARRGGVASNAEIAERADLVVLAVKPAKLDEVAPELGAAPRSSSRCSARRRWSRLQRRFPSAEVAAGDAERRRRGAPGRALRRRRRRRREVREQARRCSGTWSSCPTRDFDAATAVMGCAPAYLALAVEAIADAGAADGLDPELARELVVETAAGTAELLRAPPPGRRAQGGRLARRQHRGRAGGARPRRRPARPSRRRCEASLERMRG